MKLTGYTFTASAQEDFASRSDALRAAGCSEIIHEYATGIESYRRPKLAQTICRLRPGDKLVVTDLACIAWSLPQLIELLASLRDRGITFRALESPIDRGIIFKALESPIDTSGANGATILEALRAILAFNTALAAPAREPRTSPAASTTRRLEVMEVAARLKARRPGMTLRETGAELNRLGYKPPRGTEWSLPTVKRLLDRARLTGGLIEK